LTLVVNLFAGPGAGKSTTRAGVFHHLKLDGYNVEEAPEFAKELTWENRQMALSCQPYVFANQLYTLYRLQGQVDAIITDSPLLLGLVYARGEPESLGDLVWDKWREFDNINFFIERDKPYNPIGRNQTEDEAKVKDDEVETLLVESFVPFEYVIGDSVAPIYIAMKVKERLNGSQR
jgi:hypothetical protein